MIGIYFILKSVFERIPINLKKHKGRGRRSLATVPKRKVQSNMQITARSYLCGPPAPRLDSVVITTAIKLYWYARPQMGSIFSLDFPRAPPFAPFRSDSGYRGAFCMIMKWILVDDGIVLSAHAFSSFSSRSLAMGNRRIVFIDFCAFAFFVVRHFLSVPLSLVKRQRKIGKFSFGYSSARRKSLSSFCRLWMGLAGLKGLPH